MLQLLARSTKVTTELPAKNVTLFTDDYCSL